MQPAVQALLARKLARFIANVFQVAERGVRRGGQQRAEPGKCAARFRCIAKTLAALFRVFEKWPQFLNIETPERRALYFAEQNNFGCGGHSGARPGTDRGGSPQWCRSRG